MNGRSQHLARSQNGFWRCDCGWNAPNPDDYLGGWEMFKAHYAATFTDSTPPEWAVSK